jgi:3',5'-cyclic AMP phosphodiesterase CpdA
MNQPLRILLLSDLHIGPGGSVQTDVDDKLDNLEIRARVESNRKNDLVAAIKRACGKPEEDWPKAIIVTGDIVNRGGTPLGPEKKPNDEFVHAREFLQTVTADLKVERSRLFVVPGNHDVSWEAGLGYLERFKNYMEAMAGFSSPTVTNGKLTPFRTADLSGIKRDIDVELLLLISPTFSGVADPENTRIIRRIRQVLSDLDEEQLARIERLIVDGRGAVDIAAVGQHQREHIGSSSRPINGLM